GRGGHRRSVQFVELGNEVTLASLVCEDLAQSDEVASVIRAVGPMIVVIPLLDGPQLSSRWGARYAAVLADDPGSAVLTLTPFGMAQRSRLPGQNLSPVVSLGKGPGRKTRERPLDPAAQGILLSASARHAVRRSFDGRRPGQNGSEFFDVTVHQIRASRARIGPPHSLASSPSGPLLAADELTILTSWAEVLAEALAVAAKGLQTLAAEAQAGAPRPADLRRLWPPPPAPPRHHGHIPGRPNGRRCSRRLATGCRASRSPRQPAGPAAPRQAGPRGAAIDAPAAPGPAGGRKVVVLTSVPSL